MENGCLGFLSEFVICWPVALAQLLMLCRKRSQPTVTTTDGQMKGNAFKLQTKKDKPSKLTACRALKRNRICSTAKAAAARCSKDHNNNSRFEWKRWTEKKEKLSSVNDKTNPCNLFRGTCF
jgi:hypothetical protein